MILGITVASGYFIFYQNQQKLRSVNSFEECVKAGNLVLESYPRQCKSGGKSFTEVLPEEEKKKLVPPQDGQICAQVITPAKNIQTSECKEFPTPCDVPEGWEKVGSCVDAIVGWKTYSDKGIYFKYPAGWDISPYSNNSEITSTSPKINLDVASKDETLMNECMKKSSEKTKEGLVIKEFTRVITGAMCETTDSNEKDKREIWIIPTQDAYSPGINYQYSAAEAKQAEEIFYQILSTFKFLE